MLNEERIRLMTKLALYEQKEGREDLAMSKYYRTDYLTLKMINSAIIMTLGYLLLLGTIVLVNVEDFLTELVSMDLLSLGRNILIIYVLLFIVNMVATYIISSYRFKRSRESLGTYHEDLKELYKIYKKEEAGKNFFREDFDPEKVGMGEEDHMAEFGGINNDEVIDD